MSSLNTGRPTFSRTIGEEDQEAKDVRVERETTRRPNGQQGNSREQHGQESLHPAPQKYSVEFNSTGVFFSNCFFVELSSGVSNSRSVREFGNLILNV